jgi:hypothetical protein
MSSRGLQGNVVPRIAIGLAGSSHFLTAGDLSFSGCRQSLRRGVKAGPNEDATDYLGNWAS